MLIAAECARRAEDPGLFADVALAADNPWALGDASQAETLALLEEALLFAHQAVEEHEVLQKVLQTEPERLLPQLTVESERVLVFIRRFLLPYLEREELRPGTDPEAAADYVARMLLSFIGNQGRWNLTDPADVARLVRTELLAGILAHA